MCGAVIAAGVCVCANDACDGTRTQWINQRLTCFTCHSFFVIGGRKTRCCVVICGSSFEQVVYTDVSLFIS